MGILTKEQLRALIKEEKLVTAGDVQAMLKDLFSETLQEILEAELDTELGYAKNQSLPEGSDNRRNGHTKKQVRSGYGELSLSVPRDRQGEFEPIVVKKHQKEVTGIEEQIIALYAKGVTVREIELDSSFEVHPFDGSDLGEELSPIKLKISPEHLPD